MKLYEAKFWADADQTLRFETRYVTSRAEAGKLIRGKPRYRLSEIQTVDRLTVDLLIQLLEGDAPGSQKQLMTPVDLIIERKVLKEKSPD